MRTALWLFKLGRSDVHRGFTFSVTGLRLTWRTAYRLGRIAGRVS